MPTVDHQNLNGSAAVHQGAFVQATDPGAVGPLKSWFDTSAGVPYQHKVRNASNTSWANVGTTTGGGGGGSGGLAALQTETPSGTHEIDFTVPAGYKNLRITGAARLDISADNGQVWVAFNGDDGSTGNYIYREVFAYSSGMFATANVTSAWYGLQGGILISVPPGNPSPADFYSPVDTLIIEHMSPFYKSVHARTHLTFTGPEYAAYEVFGWWKNTAAITSLKITTLYSADEFLAGTTFTLWGESV